MSKAIVIVGATVGVAIVASAVVLHTHKGSAAVINCKRTPEKVRAFVIKYRAKRDAKNAVKTAADAVKAAEKAAEAAARSAANVFTRAAGKATAS